MFQKFEKTNARQEDRITITTSNSIGFPTKFYQDNNLKDLKYVVLYFDKDNMSIGIQFTNNEDEKHKFTILRSNRGYGGAVIATSFFKVNAIDPKIYHGRYEWNKENPEGIGELYVIKLKPRAEE